MGKSMIEISYYQSVLHTRPSTVSLNGFITALQTGADKRVAETVLKIRSLRPIEDKAEIQALKLTLPGVSFGGTFKERGNDKLIDPSGLMTLDFDDKGPVPKEIDKYAFLRFKSPQGGNREKIIVRIPLVKDNAQYRAYFNGMADYLFSLTKPKGLSDTEKLAVFRKSVESIIDLSGSDVSRFCFMSFDPDLIHNPNAVIWETRQEVKPKDPSTGVPKEEPKKSNGFTVRRIINMIL
jgi:maltooligosyltrehalose synthase